MIRSVELQSHLDRMAGAARTPDLATQRVSYEKSAPPYPNDIQIIAVRANGVNAEWVMAPGTSEGRRVLYLHGGGFFLGSARGYRRLASDLSRASGCAILTIDYRLAPEFVFPAQIDDAVAGYEYILENGPSGRSPAHAVFVGGDSAGGCLTLSLLHAIKERGMKMPNAAATMSAWTDVEGTGATMRTRSKRDPMVTPEVVKMAASTFLGGADPHNPTASPLHGDFSGFPPLFMNVGDDEVILDDTLRAAAKAGEAGVDVRLQVEPGGFHIYPVSVPDAPESKRAIQAIGSFMKLYG